MRETGGEWGISVRSDEMAMFVNPLGSKDDPYGVVVEYETKDDAC